MPATPGCETVTEDRARFLAWLQDLGSQPGLASLGESGVALWSQLERRSAAILAPPVASPWETVVLNFAWRQVAWHIEIDINADGTFGWFWRDNITGEFEGSSEADLREPPQRLLDLLTTHCSVRPSATPSSLTSTPS